MARIVEVAVGVDDLLVLAGAPTVITGKPGAPHRRIAGQPLARFWRLGPADAIGCNLDLVLGAGDRIVSLEPDIDLDDGGYLTLDLAEPPPPPDDSPPITLLHLDGTSTAARRPFPVRWTLGPKSRPTLRIAGELQNSQDRHVFGVYLRIARAS